MKRRVKRLPVWPNKISIYKLLSSLLIILFVVSVPFTVQKLIIIKRVECFSQYGSCGQDLYLRLKRYELVDYRKARVQIEQILKQDIQITDFLIQYKIPSTLKIDVTLKKPTYSINDSQNNYYVIDKNGVVINISNQSNLPTLVKTNLDYKLGDRITDSDLFFLKIIEKVRWSYSVSVGEVGDNEMILYLKEGILVHFPAEGDVDILVGELRLIFSRLNDESRGIKMNDIKEIDLRFKNPILRKV